jgi:hypothetical protein
MSNDYGKEHEHKHGHGHQHGETSDALSSGGGTGGGTGGGGTGGGGTGGGTSAPTGGGAWTGTTQTILSTDPALTMSPTSTGSMFLLLQDMSKQNNPGQVTITSGGLYTSVPLPAGSGYPYAILNNYQGNNLNVSNSSAPSSDSTPIQVMAAGLGIGSVTVTGTAPSPTSQAINPYQALQGTAGPTYNTLQINCVGTNAIVAIIGGPTWGSAPNVINGYLLMLNSSSTGGAQSGTPVTVPPTLTPDGYYAKWGGNTFSFVFNWAPGSYPIWIANLSSTGAAAVNVTMRAN